MADLVADIGSYLIGQGRAEAVGKDIFLDYLSDTPDEAICLTEYGGSGVLTAASAMTRYVQVLVRATKASEAKGRAWQIFNDLDKPLLDNDNGRVLQLTQERWALTQALQQPTPLGVDSNARFRYAFNVAFTTYRD